MKRVTLTKLLNPTRSIVAIKCLRESTRDPHSSQCSMGLKEAKDTVDTLRAGGTPTVRVIDPAALATSFEYSVVPDAEHFHATHNDSTVLVTDNYAVGAAGYGNELFIQCADGDVPMASWGTLNAREDASGALSREQAETLYEFLGDWLGKS